MKRKILYFIFASFILLLNAYIYIFPEHASTIFNLIIGDAKVLELFKFLFYFLICFDIPFIILNVLYFTFTKDNKIEFKFAIISYILVLILKLFSFIL